MSRAAIAALVVIGTILVFAPALRFGFTSLDDPAYVSGNRHVREGLTAEGLVWAFTTTEQSNWHPITWLSLMTDAQLSATNPAAFHGTNLLLHLVNALLLFLGIERLTGRTIRSAFAAALFAVHPLHVESVVWIAERKDVLSTFFLLLALGGYVAYARRPSPARLLLPLIPFALGLMAKPMLVSFPLLLLMLDLWPLGRTRQGWKRLVVEKLPFFVLSLASCVVTILAQRAGGALRPFERYPLAVRAENAVVSYAAYLAKTVWPAKLAVYYPHPHGSLSPLIVGLAALLFAALSVAAWRLRERRPYVLVGWLWYVVSLVPVIGLVQVGGQAMADRYTYVPLIGIFVAIAWGVADLATDRARRAVVTSLACLVVLLLATRARSQVLLWEKNVALFGHAVEVTPDNAFAHNCLANAFFREKRLDEAILHYREAIRISPSFADAHGNLGAALLNRGELDQAEEQCREALRLDPAHVRSHVNLALVLIRRGRLDEAADRLREALRLDPELGDAHRYLGAVHAQQGRFEEAVAELQSALRLDPSDVESRKLLHGIETDPRRRHAPNDGVE